MLFGRIEYGAEVYSIRSAANGRTIVEKIDSRSFKPEWGHDHATHGHDRVPPSTGAGTTPSGTTTTTSPTTAAATSTVEITLMSVYTPQARAAAGGTTQINGQIQAAVDQANSAFVNSSMVARFNLARTEEAAYNDTGDMNADLNWVTGNAGVASLRNTYAADMVSLIVENGGAYCGIGWVQRNPGTGFAGYAFQVTDRGCLTNGTLAHEHGHNMGMEHNPENSSVGTNPAAASYDFAFGHWVSGQFATVMTYNSICPVYCPRVMNFSNPDVLYNGFPTGILNQRDNAQTGDLTAPIIAAFRSGGTTTNSPPVFINDPITKPNATLGVAYSSTIAGSATDPNNDPLTYSKTAGPTWLAVATNGTLSGTPGATGPQSFTVSVNDGKGGSATATLQITVVAPTNSPPVFTSNPIVKANGTVGIAYSGTLAGSATDPNNDPLTFSKTGGPAWLTVASNGSLGGTPSASGLQSFTVSVSDGNGGSAAATLEITVVNPPVITLTAPSNLAASSTVSRRVDLTWLDNSSGETGFKIERSNNGSSYTQIATVGANVTSFADSNRRSGRSYYYRVRAYDATTNSGYSNTVNIVAR